MFRLVIKCKILYVAKIQFALSKIKGCLALLLFKNNGFTWCHFRCDLAVVLRAQVWMGRNFDLSVDRYRILVLILCYTYNASNPCIHTADADMKFPPWNGHWNPEAQHPQGSDLSKRPQCEYCV